MLWGAEKKKLNIICSSNLWVAALWHHEYAPAHDVIYLFPAAGLSFFSWQWLAWLFIQLCISKWHMNKITSWTSFSILFQCVLFFLFYFLVMSNLFRLIMLIPCRLHVILWTTFVESEMSDGRAGTDWGSEVWSKQTRNICLLLIS